MSIGALCLLAASQQDIQTQWSNRFKETALLKKWVYQDIKLGFSQAAKTAKPLLIV